MKLALALLAGLVLSACSGGLSYARDTLPTGPANPALPVGPGTDREGECIADVTVHVVQGQRTGETLAQEVPCDVWDSGAGGVRFRNLEPGAPMTLRATAPGYTTEEKTFIPIAGPMGSGSVVITLSRTAPTAPDTLTGNASLSAIVIDSSGLCIVGAVVEVVQGQGRNTHRQDPTCDVWRWPSNVVFDKLLPGAEMLLRASAPGYRSQLKTVPIDDSQTSAVFTLKPIE